MAAIAMFLALSFTPRQQEALHYLMTATSFESPYIGEGGTRSGGYLAMRIVARTAGADAAFKDLVAHGTLAGQLYGMIGVRRTDPAFYRANIERYKESDAWVRTVNGCIISSERVSNVVYEPKGIQLPSGTTSYTSVYLDGEGTSAAERDATAAENSFDFKQRDAGAPTPIRSPQSPPKTPGR